MNIINYAHNSFIGLLITLAILGLLAYLDEISPIAEPFKSWIRFGLIALGVIDIILFLLTL